MEIIAAGSLIALANHFKGTQVLSRPEPRVQEAERTGKTVRQDDRLSPGSRPGRGTAAPPGQLQRWQRGPC